MLGADPFLRAAFKTFPRVEDTTGAYTATTTLTNHHTASTYGVVVRDLVPVNNRDARCAGDDVPEAGDLTDAPVGLLTTLPAGRGSRAEEIRLEGRWAEGGRVDGVFEWVCEVPPRATVRIATEWAVKPRPHEAQDGDQTRVTGSEPPAAGTSAEPHVMVV